jgi:hypothetical protein
MQAVYNREDDVLLLELAEGTIDHAEDADGIIVHFSTEDRPLLIEVLDASDLLARLGKLTATARSGEAMPL